MHPLYTLARKAITLKHCCTKRNTASMDKRSLRARMGILALGLLIGAVSAAQTAAPVAYSSVSELNDLLGQLQTTSQKLQVDLAKLRIEKWKADGDTKRQAQSDSDSINRNLSAALPGMISDLKSSPDGLIATFKLYRNLDALYDVLRSVTESAGAFGGKDEFQCLQNDLDTIEQSRRNFSKRLETLAAAKDGELNTLRARVQALQATPEPPKKVVVDDTADDDTAKKPVKKKVVKKPPAPTAAPATTPSTSPQQ